MRIGFLTIILLIAFARASHYLAAKSPLCSKFIEQFPDFMCEKQSRLGFGGFAWTYVVKEKAGTGRKGVLKAPQDDQAVLASKADRQEVEFLKEVKHPNIVELLASKETPAGTLMITEFGTEGDLEGFMNRRPSLRKNRTRLLQMFRQLASAVKFVHRKGWVIRDLKPGNIVVNQFWNTKLIDFGLTTPINKPAYRGGTPGYMDIRQSQIELDQIIMTEKTDVFSLGMTFFKVAFGVQMFAGKNLEQIVEALNKAEMWLPEGLDLHIAYLIHRMIAYDLDTRYSMDQVLDLIDFALAHPTTETIKEDVVTSRKSIDRKLFPETLDDSVAAFVKSLPPRYHFVFKEKSVQKVPAFDGEDVVPSESELMEKLSSQFASDRTNDIVEGDAYGGPLIKLATIFKLFAPVSLICVLIYLAFLRRRQQKRLASRTSDCPIPSVTSPIFNVEN